MNCNENGFVLYTIFFMCVMEFERLINIYKVTRYNGFICHFLLPGNVRMYVRAPRRLHCNGNCSRKRSKLIVIFTFLKP